MRPLLTALVLFLTGMPVYASSLWQPVDLPSAQVGSNLRPSPSVIEQQLPGSRLMAADMQLLDQLLQQAPLFSPNSGGTIIDVPLPDGNLMTLEVYSAPVLAPDIARRFPQIRTYKAISTQNPAIRGRLDFMPNGFHAMLRTKNGTVFINPEHNYDPSAPDNHYRIIARGKLTAGADFNCKLADHNAVFSSLASSTSARPAAKTFGSSLKTYRLAVAATREYSNAVAGGNVTNTFSEITTAVNRINEVYERDLAIHLEIVSDTGLISTDTNDFSNDNADAMLDENQAWIDGKLTNSGYDIGHVFSTGGGGLAVVASACQTNYKAMGVTGLPNSSDLTSDVFYIEYVAHELGHQLGATHTFNASGSEAGSGYCDGSRQGHNDFPSASAYEPGSGSTIMSYAGICAEQNIQQHSDDYFHATSIEQIRQLVEGEVSGYDISSCGTTSSTGEAAPVADAGSDYTIPANTPFMLTGSATNATSPTYTWEQYDLGSATDSADEMHTDRGSGPLIRSRMPNIDPVRYIPALSAILSGDLEAETGERLPTTDRNMNFRLTVRSGSYSVDQDMMTVTVENNAGPFTVTSPGTGSYNGYDVINAQWQVANTDKPPVNCLAVDILLSSDGGQNFNTALLEGAANTGQALIAFPNTISTSNGRIRIQCHDNIFFAVSSAKFNLATTTSQDTATLEPVTAAVTEGDTGSSTMTFRIKRTNTSQNETFIWQVNGSGTDPADAQDFTGGTLPGGSVNFSTGDASKDITIDIAGDTHAESNETFTITISSGISTILVNQLEGMIQDDDTSYVKNSGGGGSSGGGSISWFLLGLMGLLLFLRKNGVIANQL